LVGVDAQLLVRLGLGLGIYKVFVLIRRRNILFLL
jgi:hypothetical protein